jgi:hypothetical protein
MSLLQTGITGFNTSAEVSAANITRGVYATAQAAGAKVGEIKPADGVTPNFHQIDVDLGGRALVVLCNRYLPVVALTERVDGMEIEQFSEAPDDFAAALAEYGFVIGDVADLNRRVTSDDLKMLSPAEQHEAKYWKPKRVGDIIFNWWD